jgi:5-methylcytosine-specific restriction endonuclease McrA
MEVIEREAPPQRYSSFLQSKEWAEIRHRVLERAGHVCEACGWRPAIIVHHLTMRYGFKPPLWCLKAVCRHCHARFRERFQSGDRRARRDDWLGKAGRSQ